MQFLGRVNQARFELSHDWVLILEQSNITDENFDSWAQLFCEYFDLQIVEKSTGLDRLGWTVKWRDLLFSLNYEHYSEQLWLESHRGEQYAARLCEELAAQN